MRVAVVKYNAGNTVSVINALARLGVEAVVTDAADELRASDRVIFPGVGEASSAMQSVRAAGLDVVIPSLTQPVLGICLGMQLLCSHSEENDTNCLGIIPERVMRFRDTGLKVPHVGWNNIRELRSALFEGVNESAYMYFVHSYYVENGTHATATTGYGTKFASAVAKDNFYGVQFHTEKSGEVGSRILENFLNL